MTVNKNIHRLPQNECICFGEDHRKVATKYSPVAAGVGEQERRLVRLRDRRTPIRTVLDADVDIFLNKPSNNH